MVYSIFYVLLRTQECVCEEREYEYFIIVELIFSLLFNDTNTQSPIFYFSFPPKPSVHTGFVILFSIDSLSLSLCFFLFSTDFPLLLFTIFWRLLCFHFFVFPLLPFLPSQSSHTAYQSYHPHQPRHSFKIPNSKSQIPIHIFQFTYSIYLYPIRAIPSSHTPPTQHILTHTPHLNLSLSIISISRLLCRLSSDVYTLFTIRRVICITYNIQHTISHIQYPPNYPLPTE